MLFGIGEHYFSAIKKSVIRIGPPLAKLSGSAHDFPRIPVYNCQLNMVHITQAKHCVIKGMYCPLYLYSPQV